MNHLELKGFKRLLHWQHASLSQYLHAISWRHIRCCIDSVERSVKQRRLQEFNEHSSELRKIRRLGRVGQWRNTRSSQLTGRIHTSDCLLQVTSYAKLIGSNKFSKYITSKTVVLGRDTSKPTAGAQHVDIPLGSSRKM